jgi:predicted transcriptional regulator
MGEVPLSLHVTAKLKGDLEQEAHLLHVSESEVVEKAVEFYLDQQALKRQILKEAAAEADKGVFISSEAMLAWMEELETDIDAPAPKPDIFLQPRIR